MEKEVRQRLQWVKIYEESGGAGLVCRRCGISRSTLRKWWKRYQAQGIDALKGLSRRPHSSPSARIGPDHEKAHSGVVLRAQLGARRIISSTEYYWGGKKIHFSSGNICHSLFLELLSTFCIGFAWRIRYPLKVAWQTHGNENAGRFLTCSGIWGLAEEG